MNKCLGAEVFVSGSDFRVKSIIATEIISDNAIVSSSINSLHRYVYFYFIMLHQYMIIKHSNN